MSHKKPNIAEKRSELLNKKGYHQDSDGFYICNICGNEKDGKKYKTERNIRNHVITGICITPKRIIEDTEQEELLIAIYNEIAPIYNHRRCRSIQRIRKKMAYNALAELIYECYMKKFTDIESLVSYCISNGQRTNMARDIYKGVRVIKTEDKRYFRWLIENTPVEEQKKILRQRFSNYLDNQYEFIKDYKKGLFSIETALEMDGFDDFIESLQPKYEERLKQLILDYEIDF